MKTFWVVVTTISLLFNMVYLMRDYQDYKNSLTLQNDLSCDVHAVIYADNIGND